MTDRTGFEPRFAGDLPGHTDVLVVGGGIAGASAAYHLAHAGVRTLLLERHEVGGGATEAAVGVLSPPVRQPFDETVHFRGEATARAMWEFALRSIANLGAVLTERNAARATELDLSGGHVLADAHSLHEVESSFRAMGAAGLPVEWLSAERIRTLIHGRGFLGGYRIEGGGGLDARATAVALAEAARDEGAVVLEGVAVSDVNRQKGVMVCSTDAGEVRAEMVVYATHTDSRRFSQFLGDEIVPIRGQAMVTEAGPPVYRGAFSTHWKLNVWRSDAQGRLRLGGWRHDAWDRSYWKARPELDEHLQDNLQGWYQATFPEAGALTVARRWSGIFGWTADYLPLVGPLPGRVGELVIAGFSGGGLPFAFEAGRVIEAIVSEKEPVPGGELLNPRRFT